MFFLIICIHAIGLFDTKLSRWRLPSTHAFAGPPWGPGTFARKLPMDVGKCDGAGGERDPR